MSREKDLLANIDIVNFPKDKTVLLGHTYDIYSIGIIQTPFDGKSLVVSLRNEVNKFASAITMQPSKLINELEIIIAGNNSEAIEIATLKLQTWLAIQSGENEMLTTDHFTDVATDAPLNKPHMHKLDGTPLDRSEQFGQEQKLGYIRDHSFPIPIQPMISALLDELA